MRAPIATARTIESHLKQRRRSYTVRRAFGRIIVGDGRWIGVRLIPGRPVDFAPWPPSFLACLLLLALASCTIGLAIPVWHGLLRARTDELACDVATLLRTELGQTVPRDLR